MMNGNRLPLTELDPNISPIIGMSWQQDPSNRLTIDRIIELLDEEFAKYN